MGASTVVGNEQRSPAPGAAFTNGTITHGIELDDTHSGASLHPGAVVLSTALAVGETQGATGTELLEAIVAGYELMIRIGRAADPSVLYERGFHLSNVVLWRLRLRADRVFAAGPLQE